MHSLGLLHCDLRPRNFLIDEYGVLKLSDFKMARKIPKTSLGNTPLEQRGCFPYMAPELFSTDGVHSFASDFWSLGCVLYELRRGVPPFGTIELIEMRPYPTRGEENGDPLDILTNRIKNAEPVRSPVVFVDVSGTNKNSGVPGSATKQDNKRSVANAKDVPAMSQVLADVLLWMLQKLPIDRCDW